MAPTRCPECKADLRGAPIPKKDRRHYGAETRFSRVTGVYDTRADRVTHWRCPKCGHTWARGGVRRTSEMLCEAAAIADGGVCEAIARVSGDAWWTNEWAERASRIAYPRSEKWAGWSYADRIVASLLAAASEAYADGD
jgi:hypothetical protein